MNNYQLNESIKALGIKIESGVTETEIVNSDGYTVAIIDETTEQCVDTMMTAFRELSDVKKQAVMDIVMSYAKTPIAERDIRKMYAVELPDKSYLAVEPMSDTYKKVREVTHLTLKTFFTAEQIEALSERIQSLKARPVQVSYYR